MTVISSTRNPRIVALRKLSTRKHRTAAGRFAVEGLQSLGMALDAGAVAREVIYCPALFGADPAPALLDRFAAAGADLIEVAPHVMESLSERDRPAGLIAVFDLLARPLDALPLSDDGPLLVLDRLSDPGNLGTLFRTADAVGAAALILLTPAADPHDPKAVRASMGSLFNVPFAVADDPAAVFAALAGHRVIAADAHAGTRWDHADWGGPVALVLGREAGGLSLDVDTHIATRVNLPVSGQADSLNVAVAAGVLLYAWVSANRP
jgi:TrmH family RNA methyltransferase